MELKISSRQIISLSQSLVFHMKKKLFFPAECIFRAFGIGKRTSKSCDCDLNSIASYLPTLLHDLLMEAESKRTVCLDLG